MSSKEIVTMPCDPAWDSWILDENAVLSINGNSGYFGTNPLGFTSNPDSVKLFSNTDMPIDIVEDLTLKIATIRDPTLDEDGKPLSSVVEEVVIESGRVLGMRKGDRLECTFDSIFWHEREEGEEVSDDQLTDDGKVIDSISTFRMTFWIESMAYVAIGPFPSNNVNGVNNMFWENDVMDCKASGYDYSLRRMASREKGANWLVDSPGNQWDSYCGWEKLFTGDTPSDGRQSGKHGSKGNCLQMATNNQMSAGQGILIGNWRAEQKNEVARWMNPTGVQFQWTTKNTPKNNANGLKLKQLWLVYKEANDGVPRYCPIVDNYEAKGEYVFERNDLLAHHQKKDKWGNFRASISAEDIIQVNARDSVCIAMLMVFNNGKSGTMYYNVIDIFNFTFLFYNATGTIDEFTGLASADTEPTLPSKSRIIVPAPFPMSEWDSGYFPMF